MLVSCSRATRLPLASNRYTKPTATVATTPVAYTSLAPLDAISAADTSGYLQAVSADEMLGRKPFTAGEERIIYLAERFKDLGLQPAGPNGGYFQPMPMTEIAVMPAATMQITGKNQKLSLACKTACVVFSQREQPTVAV